MAAYAERPIIFALSNPTSLSEAAPSDLIAWSKGRPLTSDGGGVVPKWSRPGEFVLSDHDILLGTVGGCPFYMDHRQFAAWKHTQLMLDVSDGLPEGFSLPAGADGHFVTNSRLYCPDENSEVGQKAGMRRSPWLPSQI
jgi:uncharacterized protein (DUF779 family)